MRFSELEPAIPAISQKMLIQQLRELERDGIALRTIYPQIPPRVEYYLAKVGIALRPALRALLAWATLRKEAMPPLHSHSSRNVVRFEGRISAGRPDSRLIDSHSG